MSEIFDHACQLTRQQAAQVLIAQTRREVHVFIKRATQELLDRGLDIRPRLLLSDLDRDEFNELHPTGDMRMRRSFGGKP